MLCPDLESNLVGPGARVGLYLFLASYLILYVRGAKHAANVISQSFMISYSTFLLTLYAHGVMDVADIEFISLSYMLALYAVTASLDWHMLLAHGNINSSSQAHCLHVTFRFIVLNLVSILTTCLLIAFWSTWYRKVRCEGIDASAFLFAKIPAYGSMRPFVILAACMFFLYTVAMALYGLYRLLIDPVNFISACQTNAKETEEGVYWNFLGEGKSRQYSRMLYGIQRFAFVMFFMVGAELTLRWNDVPAAHNPNSFGQILHLMMGLFTILHSILVPTE